MRPINRAALAITSAALMVLAACAPSAPSDTDSNTASDSASDTGSASADTGTAGGQSTPSQSGETAPAPAGSDDTLIIASTSDVVNYNPLVGNSRTDIW